MLIRLLQRIPRPLRMLAAALWGLAIPAASLLPACFFSHTPELDRLPHVDKVVHAALYGILTGLLLWASRQPVTLRSYGFTAAAATAYGLLMEWLQHFTPNRSMDLADALANTLGAFLVAAVALGIVTRKVTTQDASHDDRTRLTTTATTTDNEGIPNSSTVVVAVVVNRTVPPEQLPRKKAD